MNQAQQRKYRRRLSQIVRAGNRLRFGDSERQGKNRLKQQMQESIELWQAWPKTLAKLERKT
jgi:hypothetical protein